LLAVCTACLPDVCVVNAVTDTVDDCSIADTLLPVLRLLLFVVLMRLIVDAYPFVVDYR